MMRRAPFVLVGTVVGLSSVLTFRSTPATIHLSLSGGTGATGVVATGGSTTSTTVTSTSTTTSTSTVPTNTPAATTTAAPTTSTVAAKTANIRVSAPHCTTSAPQAATTTSAPTTSTIAVNPQRPTGGDDGNGDGNGGFGGEDDGGETGALGPIRVTPAAAMVPHTRVAHAVTTTTVCTAANGATPLTTKKKPSHPTTTVHHKPTTTTTKPPVTTTTVPPTTTTTVPPTTTTTVSAVRTATGATYNYQFGTMSVAVTVNGKKITNIKVASLNDFGNGRSQYIDNQAIPLLIQEAMAAQSAKIATISGASYTSAGFDASLQNALKQLGL